MRKILGFPVLATGLALALQIYNPGLFKGGIPQALSVETVKVEPAPVVLAAVRESKTIQRDDSAAQPVRSFTPGQGFAAAAKRYTPPKLAEARKPRAQPTPIAPPRETATVRVVHEVTVSPWRTSVTPVPGLAGQNAAMTSPRPQDAAARYELALQIQRELKRVGCYGGRLDGSWGVGSKRALGEFMERVNATLPTTEPDYILLSLIANHTTPICGVACPSGESMTGDGRCVPSAILAQNGRKGPPTAVTRQTAWIAEVTPSGSVAAPQPATVTATAPVAPLPGRMAVGGPIVPPAPVPAVQGGEQVTVALVEGEVPVLGPDGLPIDPSAAGAAAAGVPVVAVPPPADKPKRRSRDADSGRPSHAQRSVQNLFTHPLGM